MKHTVPANSTLLCPTDAFRESFPSIANCKFYDVGFKRSHPGRPPGALHVVVVRPDGYVHKYKATYGKGWFK